MLYFPLSSFCIATQVVYSLRAYSEIGGEGVISRLLLVAEKYRRAQEGQSQLDEIINSPDTSWETRHHARFGDIIEGKLPDGRAARWSSDGNFIGFIEA
jgi:hypothetical protein